MPGELMNASVEYRWHNSTLNVESHFIDVKRILHTHLKASPNWWYTVVYENKLV